MKKILITLILFTAAARASEMAKPTAAKPAGKSVTITSVARLIKDTEKRQAFVAQCKDKPEADIQALLAKELDRRQAILSRFKEPAAYHIPFPTKDVKRLVKELDRLILASTKSSLYSYADRIRGIPIITRLAFRKDKPDSLEVMTGAHGIYFINIDASGERLWSSIEDPNVRLTPSFAGGWTSFTSTGYKPAKFQFPEDIPSAHNSRYFAYVSNFDPRPLGGASEVRIIRLPDAAQKAFAPKLEGKKS